MATTRIISMHVSHGKTIADCLTDRIDYSKNPDKTQGGELISAYECDPKTADAEFLFAKRQYQTITGREQRHDVIAYQVDLWFMTLPDLLELTEKVDEALTSLGLIRQFASSDALLHDPSGYLRKSLRYGRRVDTRTNRLID